MKKLVLIILAIPLMVFASEEDIWFANGMNAMDVKNYAKAVEYFSKIIQKDSNNVKAIYNRGLAFLMWQKFENAFMDFDRTIALDSTNADAYNNRGYLNYLAGQNAQAMDDFNRAISLDSNFAQAYINRGSNYIDINLFKPAYKDLQKAIKLNPDSPSPYLELGRYYYKTGKYKKSVENYSKCIKMNLKNPKIYYSRGNSYFKMGEYKKAIADYSETLKANPNDFDALNNRAVAYDKLGKKDLAQKDRMTLQKRSGTENIFVPFDKIVFVKSNDSLDNFTFEMPKNWYKREHHSAETHDLVISPEKIKDYQSPYSIGIKMSLIQDMDKKYNVSNRDSLLDFWEGSIEKNAENYHSYRIALRKKFARVGRYGRLNKSIVQFTEKSYPMFFYEYALAEKNTLFYAFFQCPIKQKEYFEKIFDKIVDSIRIIQKKDEK